MYLVTKDGNVRVGDGYRNRTSRAKSDTQESKDCKDYHDEQSREKEDVVFQAQNRYGEEG